MKKILLLFILISMLLTSCSAGGNSGMSDGSSDADKSGEASVGDDTTVSETETAEVETGPAVKYEDVSVKPDGFDDILFHGRTLIDEKGANIEWAYSGFTVSGYFDGTIKMRYGGKEGYLKTVYLLVTVDGKRQEELVALTSASGIVAIANVEKGYHVITVRKGAEITAGRFVMTELLFNGKLEKTVTDEKALRLEIIGDSVSNGVGAIVTETQEYRYPLGSNCLASFSGILSEKIGAETNVVAMSGYGISKGASSAGDRIPPIYEYVSPFAGKDVKYDFGSFDPDAVIFELGTNDHGGNTDKFISEAELFLKTVRSEYPDAPIVWIYGFGGYDLRDAISEVMKNTGDENIFYLEVKTDKTGRANHPCEESQIEYADQLIAKLHEIIEF